MNTFGSGQSAGDEYQRLMAERAAAAKRNRMIGIGVALVVVGAVAAFMVLDRQKKNAAQEKMAFFERFAAVDKDETGSFWNCVTGAKVDVGQFSTADQVLARIESAYAVQQTTYADLITSDCVPKIERATSAANGLDGAPDEFKPALEKYKSTLPKLQAGIETYAEKIKGRGGIKDVDKLIQTTGDAWHASTDPTPEAVAFEKFLNCAVPDLQEMKDPQTLLQFLADQCFKKDVVAFMNDVRGKCGGILTEIDKDAKPSKTWAATRKKVYEDDARQLSAWNDCGRKSRKGKKSDDLEAFLMATGDYMEARSGVAAAARSIAESVSK